MKSIFKGSVTKKSGVGWQQYQTLLEKNINFQRKKWEWGWGRGGERGLRKGKDKLKLWVLDVPHGSCRRGRVFKVFFRVFEVFILGIRGYQVFFIRFFWNFYIRDFQVFLIGIYFELGTGIFCMKMVLWKPKNVYTIWDRRLVFHNYWFPSKHIGVIPLFRGSPPDPVTCPLARRGSFGHFQYLLQEQGRWSIYKGKTCMILYEMY